MKKIIGVTSLFKGKRFSGGLMFSALTLLLLFAFLFFLFLGDYQVKMNFQNRLKNYYLAKSLKLWSEGEFQKNPQLTTATFKEGLVTIEWVPAKEKYRYLVLVQGQEFHFYGEKIAEEEKTELSTEISEDFSSPLENSENNF